VNPCPASSVINIKHPAKRGVWGKIKYYFPYHLVEISGYQQRVLYQKGPMLTDEELTRLYYSVEGEERIRQCRIEEDAQLDRLSKALKADDKVHADECRAQLTFLTKELYMFADRNHKDMFVLTPVKRITFLN